MRFINKPTKRRDLKVIPEERQTQKTNYPTVLVNNFAIHNFERWSSAVHTTMPVPHGAAEKIGGRFENTRKTSAVMASSNVRHVLVSYSLLDRGTHEF